MVEAVVVVAVVLPGVVFVTFVAIIRLGGRIKSLSWKGIERCDWGLGEILVPQVNPVTGEVRCVEFWSNFRGNKIMLNYSAWVWDMTL